MFLNKVVLITGAGSGIGAQTAVEFSKLGAKLAITGRCPDKRRPWEKLESVAKSCKDVSPGKLSPLLITADLLNECDIQNIISKTINQYCKLDVLVNNAGILEAGTIENTSLDQYDRVMNTNVRGPFYLTMLATPHLIASKGNIVNLSSVVGIRSFPNILAYCMSKAAVDQMTRCIALELGLKGVRVNNVNPGVITSGLQQRDGKMSKEEYAKFLEKSKDTHALGRAGDVKEVAAAITFLASDSASFITGASLPVDGGRHAMCPR